MMPASCAAPPFVVSLVPRWRDYRTFTLSSNLLEIAEILAVLHIHREVELRLPTYFFERQILHDLARLFHVIVQLVFWREDERLVVNHSPHGRNLGDAALPHDCCCPQRHIGERRLDRRVDRLPARTGGHETVVAVDERDVADATE